LKNKDSGFGVKFGVRGILPIYQYKITLYIWLAETLKTLIYQFLRKKKTLVISTGVSIFLR